MLSQRAERGDSGAAYNLHRWLSECRYAFADDEALEGAIARLRKEHVLQFPDYAPPPTSRPSSNVAVDEAGLRQVYEFCKGVTAEQRAQAPAWLNMAVARGDLVALRAQAMELRRSAPDRYYEAVKSLWEDHGFTGALSPLAVIHKHGRTPEGQPDYVRAYAYQFAELKLVESVYGNSQFPSHRNLLRGIEGALSNTSSYLTPQETQEAIALAERYLKDNPHCCVGILFGMTK
jgi:hypothetical protein